MTRDEAVVELKEGLGFRRDTSRDQTYQRALNQAQAEFETWPTLPWFLQVVDDIYAFKEGNPFLDLPVGYIRDMDTVGLSSPMKLAGSQRFMKKLPYDIGMDYYKLGRGTPEAFALNVENVRAFPIPDQDYAVLFYWYKKDEVAPLGSGGDMENKWLKNFPYLMIARAGIIMARKMHNGAALVSYQQEFASRREEYVRMVITREQENMQFVMGKLT